MAIVTPFYTLTSDAAAGAATAAGCGVREVIRIAPCTVDAACCAKCCVAGARR